MALTAGAGPARWEYAAPAGALSGLGEAPGPEQPQEYRAAEEPLVPPEIEVDEDISSMARQACAALADVPTIFVRDYCLVDLVDEGLLDADGRKRPPWVRKTCSAHLTDVLSDPRYCRWFTTREVDGEELRRPSRPDKQVVSAVLAHGVWPGVKRLRGVVSTPVICEGGRLLQEPGFDHESGLYFDGSLVLDPINPRPSRVNVESALRFLLDPVADFPFVNRDLGLGVWLALVLTRFARHAFRGCVPMWVVSAGEMDAGKTKLLNAAAIVADGRVMETSPFTGDPDEDARVILMRLSEGTPTVCLDNIAEGLPLASTSYEAMLTNQTYSGREIGTSKSRRVTFMETIWTATGNGLRTGGDMARRVLRVDLDGAARPAGWRPKYPDLEGHCLWWRPRLVRAALTVLRGWYAAREAWEEAQRSGAPWDGPPPVRKFPSEFNSFEAWAGVVRQCVAWCGFLDPVLAIGRAEDDAAQSQRPHLYQHLRELCGAYPGASPSEMVRALDADGRVSGRRWRELRDFLLEHGVKLVGDGAVVSLGKFLRAHAGKTVTVRGERLRLSHKSTNGGARYWVDVL